MGEVRFLARSATRSAGMMLTANKTEEGQKQWHVVSALVTAKTGPPFSAVANIVGPTRSWPQPLRPLPSRRARKTPLGRVAGQPPGGRWCSGGIRTRCPSHLI